MAMNLGGASKKQRATPTINVTPLVDVVLVVLIIFMVTVTMITKTFWLNLPKAEKDEPPPPTDDKPLVMTVDKDGVIRINQTVLSKAQTRERVVRMLAAKNQKVLYFDAHDKAPYGKAVEAMDLARSGGVKSIAMLTETVMR